MREFQRKLTNGFYALLSLPSTAMCFALAIQGSALSWILTTQYHLDIEQVGIVWAAGPIAGIIGQVVVGMISDRVWFWGGRRKPLIAIGGILTACMLLALPHIERIHKLFPFLSLLVVAAIVALTLDLAINLSFNPTRSIIADVTPKGQPRTKGYTWMQTISGFFGVLAYLIGATFGNYALIYFGAILILAFCIVPIFFISEPRELRAETGEGAGSARQTQWDQLFRIYGAHALSWIGVFTMFVYIIAFIQQKMLQQLAAVESAVRSGQIIAISFAILNTVGFILPVVVLEPLSKRFGRVKVHLASVASMAAGYFAVAAAGTTPIALYVLMGVLGIGWGSIVSLPFAIMTEKVERSQMGLHMGVFNLSVVLPQLFASLALGRVIMHASDKSVIFLISGVSLAASALFWGLVSDSRNAGEPAGVARTH